MRREKEEKATRLVVMNQTLCRPGPNKDSERTRGRECGHERTR